MLLARPITYQFPQILFHPARLPDKLLSPSTLLLQSPIDPSLQEIHRPVPCSLRGEKVRAQVCLVILRATPREASIFLARIIRGYRSPTRQSFPPLPPHPTRTPHPPRRDFLVWWWRR